MRLFVALALPDAATDALLRIMSGLPGARWEPAENLHLTLRFIGEVDNGVFADIAEGLAEIAAPAFDLEIKGIGHFDDRRRVHALWAALAPAPALRHLRDKIESLLVRLGLEPERRKFLPHITLARLRDTPSDRVAAFESHHNLMALAPFRVGEFHLYSSRPGKDRAAYHIEASYPLMPA
jgi:2'-5' RNA ligase